MPWLIALVVAAWWFGWIPIWQGYTYRAEVGYHYGSRQDWYVGPDQSLEDCRQHALSMYHSKNSDSPRRAFSWACRKMQGDSFLERVR